MGIIPPPKHPIFLVGLNRADSLHEGLWGHIRARVDFVGPVKGYILQLLLIYIFFEMPVTPIEKSYKHIQSETCVIRN